MTISVKVARKPKPKLRTRPFTEREKEWNGLSMAQMNKKLLPLVGLDPYRLRTIEPFKYMSVWKVQQFIKQCDAYPDEYWVKEYGELPWWIQAERQLESGINLVYMIKDEYTKHGIEITVSEALAIFLHFNKRVTEIMSEQLGSKCKDKKDIEIQEEFVKNKLDFTEQQEAEAWKYAIAKFKKDWEGCMDILNSLYRS